MIHQVSHKTTCNSMIGKFILHIFPLTLQIYVCVYATFYAALIFQIDTNSFLYGNTFPLCLSWWKFHHIWIGIGRYIMQKSRGKAPIYYFIYHFLVEILWVFWNFILWGNWFLMKSSFWGNAVENFDFQLKIGIIKLHSFEFEVFDSFSLLICSPWPLLPPQFPFEMPTMQALLQI